MVDCVMVFPRASLDSPTKGQALSIFYPGAMLEEHGYEVEYVDLRFDSVDRLVKLCKKNPTFVGVSSMTGSQLIGAKQALETIKKINPDIPTVMGGVHASLLPEQVIRENNLVDFVVISEGEQTMLDLMKELKGQKRFDRVKGILFKKDGKLIQTPQCPFMNPKNWPFPYTEKTKKYFKIAAKTADLFYPSSRGCPHNCRFCYNTVYNRNTWRPMPLEKFQKEMSILIGDMAFDFVSIADDNISRNKNRILSVGKLLKENDIGWHTSLRCDYFDKEMIDTLEKAGCTGALLGIESGSERVLNEVIGKNYANGIKDIKNCTRLLSKTNISGLYSFMCNTPTETRKELYQSMALADWIKKTDKNARISFFVYAPYPGTELYHTALKQGFKEPQNMEEWSKITLNNPVNPIAENLYYIAGLHFRADKTSRNFPGFKRFKIAPYELAAHFRWKTRWLSGFSFEKKQIKKHLNEASKKVNVDISYEEFVER